MDPLSTLLLQGSPPVAPEAAAEVGVVGRATGTFVGTLIVGALLLVVAPDYTERVMDTVEEHPGRSFLWGIGVLVALVIVTVLLVVTVVGIFVAVPLLLVMLLFYLVGSAIVFVLVGERALAAADVDSSRWGDLAVGAVAAAVLASIPFVGGLANFVVNSVGIGAIVYRWRRGDGEADGAVGDAERVESGGRESG
jgi:hypothetical protein